MSRYKASDIARLGDGAQRQIIAAKIAFRLREELAAEVAAEAMTSKYGNVKIHLDGMTFASKAEADRYCDLRMLALAGRVTELVCQPVFPLMINGHTVCRYIADFQYIDEDGNKIIEDVKSKPTKTPIYRLKKKLMLAILGLSITEFET